MNNLIEQTKLELNDERVKLIKLTKATNELEQKVNEVRKFSLSIVVISFIVHFFGYIDSSLEF